MTPYDTAADLALSPERAELQQHIARLDEIDSDLVALGGNLQSVLARLEAAKERME